MCFYVWNLLIALDQLAAVVFFAADPDETISSLAGKGRARGNRFWAVVASILDCIQPGHSENAIDISEGQNSVRNRIKRWKQENNYG
jgi:hypothetical protein